VTSRAHHVWIVIGDFENPTTAFRYRAGRRLITVSVDEDRRALSGESMRWVRGKWISSRPTQPLPLYSVERLALSKRTDAAESFQLEGNLVGTPPMPTRGA